MWLLTNCPSIQSLHLRDIIVTPSSLEFLRKGMLARKLPPSSLRDLHIYGLQRFCSGATFLRLFPSLRSILINCGSDVDEGMVTTILDAFFNNCWRLERVEIENKSDILFQLPSSVANLKRLNYLTVEGFQVNDDSNVDLCRRHKHARTDNLKRTS